jgi:hypothetical protein
MLISIAKDIFYDFIGTHGKFSPCLLTIVNISALKGSLCTGPGGLQPDILFNDFECSLNLFPHGVGVFRQEGNIYRLYFVGVSLQ